jgi:hypothetical protein
LVLEGKPNTCIYIYNKNPAELLQIKKRRSHKNNNTNMEITIAVSVNNCG